MRDATAPGDPDVVPDGADDGSVLLQALGFDDPGSFDARALWEQRRSCGDRQWAQIPVGVKPDGQLQHITFQGEDFGGCGFHSVVIGASGLDKSRFFLSMVYAVAMTHSPEAFTVILADPQHNSIAERISDLPHVVAAASGLRGDHLQAELLRKAIDAELVRRYWLFAAVGAGDAKEYEEIRLAGRDLEPMPILLVVVDEYQELFQHPLWIDLITEIGQMGRSANMFFMLGGPSVDTASWRKVESNIGFRVTLGAQTQAASRTAIDGDDARHQPAETSGLAVLQTRDGDVESFQCLDLAAAAAAPPTMSAGDSRGGEIVPNVGCSKLLLSDLLRDSLKAAGYPSRPVTWPISL